MSTPYTPIAHRTFDFMLNREVAPQEKNLTLDDWKLRILMLLGLSTTHQSSLMREYRALALPGPGITEKEDWMLESPDEKWAHGYLHREEFTPPCPTQRKRILAAFLTHLENTGAVIKHTDGVKCKLDNAPMECTAALGRLIQALPNEKDAYFGFAQDTSLGPVKLGDIRSFQESTTVSAGGPPTKFEVSGKCDAVMLHSLYMNDSK